MYKAMIVDDEQTIVTGLSRLLPWEKYHCEVAATAQTGEEALRLVPALRPDILFTDIRMPGMDGLALIAALRSEYPDMQVTILSGHPEFEYARQAMRLGVCSYVLKPSKMQELEEALRLMCLRLDETAQGAVSSRPTPEAAGDGSSSASASAEESALPPAAGAHNFIVANTQRYLEKHFSEKLTLPDVAAKVYVSQWHLSKLIAKTTGQSFNDLLNSIRIREAKRLLADPAMKIWEVSDAVGFSDVTHFSRIFKKLEGKSANEYRNGLPG